MRLNHLTGFLDNYFNFVGKYLNQAICEKNNNAQSHLCIEKYLLKIDDDRLSAIGTNIHVALFPKSTSAPVTK